MAMSIRTTMHVANAVRIGLFLVLAVAGYWGINMQVKLHYELAAKSASISARGPADRATAAPDVSFGARSALAESERLASRANWVLGGLTLFGTTATPFGNFRQNLRLTDTEGATRTADLTTAHPRRPRTDRSRHPTSPVQLMKSSAGSAASTGSGVTEAETERTGGTKAASSGALASSGGLANTGALAGVGGVATTDGVTSVGGLASTGALASASGSLGAMGSTSRSSLTK